MSTRTVDDLAFVDTFAPGFLADQRTAYRDLVREHWAVRSPRGVELLSYAACAGALQDERFVSGAGRVMELFGPDFVELTVGTGRTLLLSEGADHHELRSLVQPWFTPRRIDALRGAATRLVDRLLDDVEADGACEFVAAVARVVPGAVFCWMIGAPERDGPALTQWSEALLRAFAMVPEERPAILAAGDELRAYIRRLVDTKRAEPGDDVTSLLIAAHDAGRVRADDVESLLLEMLSASSENTIHSAAIQLALLASHPDQWAHVAGDPSLVDKAVEECGRFDPRVGVNALCNPDATTFHELELPAGTISWTVFAAAHQDASVYEHPEVFDVRRAGKSHLSFGAGRHYCLGASLARMELRVILERLVTRWESPRLLDGAAVEHANGASIRALPVAFTPRHPGPAG